MLTIHHLGHSQSERIVWLCEELGLTYNLLHYTRDAVTRLSPPELKALHPLGAAPVVEDGDLLLAESAAVVEYIIVKHGGGRLKPGPDHPDYAAFLYRFHFSNGNLQPRDGPAHDGEQRQAARGPPGAHQRADPPAQDPASGRCVCSSRWTWRRMPTSWATCSASARGLPTFARWPRAIRT
jgi:glutathione S-transferase